MKRVFLQEAKIASSHNFQADLVSAKSQKQELSGGNRKARTSAAMLGLALSMGASGVLFHRDSEAFASEPMAAEPAFSATPTPHAVSATRHIVREGQTLWQIAQEHQVDVTALAAVNGLSPDALLPVGTALQVPAKTEVVAQVPTQPVKPQDSAEGKVLEKSSTPVQVEISANNLHRYEQLDADLKLAQDESLARLSNSSDELSASLDAMRLEVREDEELPEMAAASTSPTEVDVSVPETDTALSNDVVVDTSVDETLDTALDTDSLAVAALEPSTDRVVVDTTPDTEIAEVPVSFSSVQAASEALNTDDLPSVLPQIQVDQPLLKATPGLDSNVDDESIHVATNAVTAAESQERDATSQTSYQIQPGDTLNQIARQYGVTREQLMSVNGITNPNVIWAGATLIIPGAEPSTSVKEPEATVTVVASRDVSNLIERPAQAETASQEVVAVRPNLSVPVSSNSYNSESNREISPYAARLLEEIRQMRSQKAEQVAASSTSIQDVETAQGGSPSESDTPQIAAAIAPAQLESAEIRPVAALSDEPVNPEFERQNRLDDQAPELEAGADERNSAESQLIAAAPVGSESYAPLAQPVSGQMVSPQLPSLPGADEYLPETISQGYIWPAQGVLTSGYGWRWGRMHKGIDVAAPVGTPIYASASGVVERSGWNSGGYGNLVDIRHPDGSLTRYAHNSRLLVSVGQRVRQGEQIAEMGSTGYSTGPHVHFEIHPPNQGATNPMAYLPGR